MKKRDKRGPLSIGRTTARKLRTAGTVVFMAGLVYVALLRRSFNYEKETK